jgi:hypothetical protein
MEAKAIVAYVVCDEVVKNLEIQENKQSKMSMAEVMTTGIIASLEYFGNIEKSRKALWQEKYIPNMLSKSQLNRRLHRIGKDVRDSILEKLAKEFEKENIGKEFVTDSFPHRFSHTKKSKAANVLIFKSLVYMGLSSGIFFAADRGSSFLRNDALQALVTLGVTFGSVGLLGLIEFFPALNYVFLSDRRDGVKYRDHGFFRKYMSLGTNLIWLNLFKKQVTQDASCKVLRRFITAFDEHKDFIPKDLQPLFVELNSVYEEDGLVGLKAVVGDKFEELKSLMSDVDSGDYSLDD